jgi:hypothetical protein
VSPFSFLVTGNYDPATPPPTYIDLATIQADKSTKREDILYLMHRDEKNGGLICTDEAAINK